MWALAPAEASRRPILFLRWPGRRYLQERLPQSGPQGLKPSCIRRLFGTTEVVPFQNWGVFSCPRNRSQKTRRGETRGFQPQHKANESIGGISPGAVLFGSGVRIGRILGHGSGRKSSGRANLRKTAHIHSNSKEREMHRNATRLPHKGRPQSPPADGANNRPNGSRHGAKRPIVYACLLNWSPRVSLSGGRPTRWAATRFLFWDQNGFAS